MGVPVPVEPLPHPSALLGEVGWVPHSQHRPRPWGQVGWVPHCHQQPHPVVAERDGHPMASAGPAPQWPSGLGAPSPPSSPSRRNHQVGCSIVTNVPNPRRPSGTGAPSPHRPHPVVAVRMGAPPPPFRADQVVWVLHHHHRPPPCPVVAAAVTDHPFSVPPQPADGVHSATAQCTLRVTVITDEMLSNSITLRLANMSQERFLSPLLSRFLEGVATVLATPRHRVVLFNIQTDTDVGTARILNVSLSVLLPASGHGARFFSSEELQERLYLNRSLLAAVSAQRVLPFDDNICLREPCENYMRCVSVLQFDSSAPFLASDTILFRPIHPVTGLRCRCPPGFTGDYCETEIDLCYSSPCGSNGRCRSREGGYTCECHEDFTGERPRLSPRSPCPRQPSSGDGGCVGSFLSALRPVPPQPSVIRPSHALGVRPRCPFSQPLLICLFLGCSSFICHHHPFVQPLFSPSSSIPPSFIYPSSVRPPIIHPSVHPPILSS